MKFKKGSVHLDTATSFLQSLSASIRITQISVLKIISAHILYE